MPGEERARGVDPPRPDPSTEPVPEPQGTRLFVTGKVVDFYQRGAVVQFPTALGGAIGVATTILGKQLHDRVELGCVVVKADRDHVDVIFDTDGADGQTATLHRFRNTIALSASATGGITP